MANEEDEQSNPGVRYVKYDHDIPKQYCCRAMREGVEDIEFIQYCERFDEYSFSSYHGYPLANLSYCPYCGTEIHSLRALFSVKRYRYRKEKGWRLGEVERYWELYRQGKSEKEAERVVEQEKNLLSAQE
ncbi:MAG: hypothetical protein ACRDZY_03090 [Acidimicrobiales bacterium]